MYFNPEFGASILPPNVATFFLNTGCSIHDDRSPNVWDSRVRNHCYTSKYQNSSWVSPRDVQYSETVRCEFGLLKKWNGFFSVKSLTLSFLCLYSVLDKCYSFWDMTPCWLVISATFGGSCSPHLQHSRIITLGNVLCTEAEFWERDFLIKGFSPLWLRDSKVRHRLYPFSVHVVTFNFITNLMHLFN